MGNISQKDIDYIKEQTNCDVETKDDMNYTGIIIKNFTLPTDMYNFDYVDVLIVVPSTYPKTQLDMFFTSEILRYKETSALPKQTQVNQIFFGKQWQRWSRHYSWNPISHNIRTHLNVVLESLENGQNT